MNWSKAKNICIVTFLLLNIVLMLLLYLDGRQYIITAESKQAITTVLNNNQITFNEDFSFTRHDPKRRLSLISYTLNQNMLANLFLINSTNIIITPHEYGTTFHTENEKIRFYPTRAFYKNISIPLYLPTENYKRLFATNTIISLGEIGRYFAFHSSTSEYNRHILDYRQTYRNNIIYSNYIVFTFYDNNISTINFSFTPVEGFIGSHIQIRPPNEALLAFMRKATSPIVIDNVDIVYIAQGLIAVPFYRIKYTQNNIVNTMLLDAYNLQIILE